ncbi:hypothetical protein ON010_g4571 [Phytophthora cinnamomi]|nr:hypothetical protein ON010_g4571 [Phytophthora cinnamomi]
MMSEWDMGDVDDRSAGAVASVFTYTAAAGFPVVAEEEHINAEREEIRDILLQKVDEARQFGASEEFVKEFEEMLMQLIDVFRIIIGRDPSVDMPPMPVKWRPGTSPVKCKARRYSPVHRAFLKKHIDALTSARLCYRNPKSRWCSLPHVVNKLEAHDYRMAVVSGPNAAWSLFDMALLALLKKVLTIGAEKDLKLNPKKCRFYLREALWCGRVISGEGIRHDPTRIDALTKLPAPTIAQELHQFVCALNWMGVSLPDFNKLIDSLVKTMGKVYERAGGRKQQHVRAIKPSDVGSQYTPTRVGAAITQIPPGHANRPLRDENVWVDLLSNWGSTLKTVCAIRQVPPLLSPQLDETVVWPTLEKLVAAQSAANPQWEFVISNEDAVSLWKEKQGRICILLTTPQNCNCDAVTLKNISEKFIWKEMVRDVEFFVQSCLHCASTLRGPSQPRLLGGAMYAEHPNDLLHWDVLYMVESDTGEVYALVIENDASKYVWLVPREAADADTTVTSLLDWFAMFGVCQSWVSVQGTHFKNKVIEARFNT